jgi:phage tail-like protein
MAADALPRPDGLIGVRGRDQWLHCSFARTGAAQVALEEDEVLLAALPPPLSAAAAAGPTRRRGLALDRMGRLYRADPAAGRVLVQPLAQAGITTLAAPEAPEPLPDATDGPAAPSVLAVTGDDHLIVLGEDGLRVHVYDLLARRHVGSHALPRRALDLAQSAGRIHVLLSAPSAWLSFSLCERPRPLTWPAAVAGASRLAFSSCGSAFVLCDAGTAAARVIDLGRPRRTVQPLAVHPVPFATEIALLVGAKGRMLVAATGAGQPLRRILLAAEGPLELGPLDGRTYDGAGLLALPEGKVLFFARSGLRDLGPMRGSPMRRRFATQGDVVLYRLDSGQVGNRWGRLFLEVCLPEGTGVQPLVRTTEVEEDTPAAARIAPANVTGTPVLAGEALAVLPPDPVLAQDNLWTAVPLFRRAAGPGRLVTCEAPVAAPPGRYLWLRLILTGRGSTTPRLRRVLAERQGHDWLRHLPRAFARRDAASEGFLQAFLTPAAGLLAETDGAAGSRHRLFDAATCPAEALPWLGETLGLPVEPEWPEPVARAMLAEALPLLRARGTVAGLTRMLEILTGARVTIVEAFRLRAGGGVGGAAARTANAVVGAGFRIGGSLDKRQTDLAPGADSAVATHAHRFTVLVHARLSAPVEQAVRRLLDRHRPAHTLYTLCSVDAGLRVGVGGLVGITSLIGPTSGFAPAILGGTLVGKGSLVARGGLSPDVFAEGQP